MELSRNRRILALSFLLVALVALLVVGGIDRPPAPSLGAYPGASDIADDPTAYHNQQVLIGGNVVATDPLVIQATYDTADGVKPRQFQITDVEESVERGDHLQVFGVLVDEQTVRATTVVVYPQTGQWYAWFVSFLAGLWVLGRLIRHWTIDFKTGAFQPRGEALRVLPGRDD